MKLIRSHPIFSALMLCALIAAAVEIWMTLAGRDAELELEEQLQFRLAEIERMLRQAPAPNQDNLGAAREDFIQNATVLATMLRSLNVAGPDELEYFKGEPTKSTDAYFDIAQFVDRMQQAAQDAEVELAPNERFGFSDYANVGPEPELIRAVYRQRRIVEYLLRALFSAQPSALVSVQREVPVPVSQTEEQPKSEEKGRTSRGARKAAPPATADPAPGGDFFVIDPQVSARTPEYVDTMPFRITFTGQTAALRGFMNALAAPEIPLVVRSVEVEPATEGSAGDAPAGRGRPPGGIFGGGAGEAPTEDTRTSIPIVSENVSRFTVTVELFEVKIRPPDLNEMRIETP